MHLQVDLLFCTFKFRLKELSIFEIWNRPLGRFSYRLSYSVGTLYLPKFRIRYRTSTLKYLTYTVKHYLISCTKCRSEWLGTVIKLARRSQEAQYLAKLKSRAPRRGPRSSRLQLRQILCYNRFSQFLKFRTFGRQYFKVGYCSKFCTVRALRF